MLSYCNYYDIAIFNILISKKISEIQYALCYWLTKDKRHHYYGFKGVLILKSALDVKKKKNL